MQIKTIFGLAALAGLSTFAAPASAQVGLDWIRYYSVAAGSPGIFSGSEENWLGVTGDDAGNVIVCGYSSLASGAATQIDIIVRKYDPTGAIVWTYQKDVAGFFDFARAVVCDASNNVYIAGEADYNAARTDSDGVITKINGATGAEIWQRIVLNAPAGGSPDDGFYDLCVARDGSAVYGAQDWSTAVATNYAMGITRTNGAGVVTWTNVIDGAGSPTGYDQMRKVRLAPNGDVIGMGLTRHTGADADARMVRYTPAGALVYNTVYSNNGVFAGATDTFFDLAVDSTGAAVMAGRSADSAAISMATAVKIGPAGALVWQNRFNPNATFTAEGVNIAVDCDNHVYISGGAPGVGGTTTASWFSFVRKLNRGTGAQIWRSADFDGNGVAGVAGRFDSTRGLFAENGGNIICSHQSSHVPVAGTTLSDLNTNVRSYDGATGALVYDQVVNSAVNTSQDSMGVGAYTVLGCTAIAGLHVAEFTSGSSQNLDGMAALVCPTLGSYIALPGTLFVGPGVVIGGLGGNIHASDNFYYHLQLDPSSEETGDPIRMTWETTSPVASPAAMRLLAEVNPEIDGCNANLSLFNWGTSQFETVAVSISMGIDNCISFAPTGSLSRFVRSTDRRVRAQVGIEPVAAEVDIAFKTDVDQAVVQIRP